MSSIALFQMTSGVDPEVNIKAIEGALETAADGGAAMLFTPEMATLLDRNRKRAAAHITSEDENRHIEQVRNTCSKNGIWCSVGSIPVVHTNGKCANRSLVITDKGEIAARYDKIHMFDVDLESGESWRESAAYQPGEKVVTVETPVGKLGLAICYDLRFPALFEELGRRKCDSYQFPRHLLCQREKRIGTFCKEPGRSRPRHSSSQTAQSGKHQDGRSTFGHSLVIDPWA